MFDSSYNSLIDKIDSLSFVFICAFLQNALLRLRLSANLIYFSDTDENSLDLSSV